MTNSHKIHKKVVLNLNKISHKIFYTKILNFNASTFCLNIIYEYIFSAHLDVQSAHTQPNEANTPPAFQTGFNVTPSETQASCRSKAATIRSITQ